LGATSFGNLLEHVARRGKCQLAKGDAGTVVADRSMKHETSVGLHRTTKIHGGVLYRADFKREVEVDTLEQTAHGKVGGPVHHQTQGALTGVLADVNNRTGQVTAYHARHGKQKLSGEVDDWSRY